MKNLKLKLSMVVYFLICFSILTGCTNKSPELSEDFDEEQVKIAAEKVVKFVNNKDSETILAGSTFEMKAALTEEVLSEIFKTVEEAGEFKKVEKITVVGHQDKESDEEFIVAVAKAKYKNKNLTYTITFDKEGQLAGLFYK